MNSSIPWKPSSLSPARHALAAALTAAGIETLIMRFNPLMPEGRPWPVALADGLSLAVILVPALYFFLFRPLGRTVDACRRAEAIVESMRSSAGVDVWAGEIPWHEDEARVRRYMSPVWLTAITAVAVFAAETVIMRIVPTLPEVHPWPFALVDSASLVLVLTPPLYIFLFRPLTRTLGECLKAQDALRLAKIEWARILRERNEELAAANQHLREEIQERRRAEEALRGSEEMYRSLVETMNEGLCVVDENRCISYVNHRLLEMMGYSKDEMLGLHTERFVDEEGRRVFAEQQAKRRRGERDPYELPLLAKDGHRVHALVSPKAVFDSGGRFLGSFAVVTDISDLKRNEEKLTQWRKYLHVLSGQLMAAQEQERARIARELHDGLGQTLTAIKFLIEGAWTGPSSGRRHADRQLDLTVQKLQEAVEEVRRICMALRPAILDDLGIVATIQWFCREFQAAFPTIGVQSQVEVQEDEVPDALKIVIFRLLQEAMNNAGKHSRASRVGISLKREADAICFHVKDNGAGFDVAAALALRSEERRFGLDSMRERTLLSGGQFWIDSADGTGTEVRAVWQLSELLEPDVPAPPTSLEE